MYPDDETTSVPPIGVFRTAGALKLERAANGGWVISQPGPHPMSEPETIGAYSDTRDMLIALSEGLGYRIPTLEP